MEHPQVSDAAQDLVKKALAVKEGPLYVAAIGAITNVASAILMEPKIIEKIVVVWLGGNALHWPDTKEFNLKQDMAASRLILDCGVPLVQIPVMGVTSHLHTTLSEIDTYVKGQGAIGDYLAKIYQGFFKDHFGRSKVIWDIAAIAYLINPEWLPSKLVPSPILTDELTWGFNDSRHQVRYAWHVSRDPVFSDLFAKLEKHMEK